MMRKKKFFKLVKWILNKQVSGARKKWKTNAWILIWVKKWQTKKRARAGGSKNFSSFQQKLYKKEFLKLIRVKLEKKSLKNDKKWTSVWCLDLGQKIKNPDSKKNYARAIGGKFFSGCYEKMLKGKFFSLVTIRIEKKSEVRKTRKTSLYLL